MKRGFAPGQQAEYRELVWNAWLAHCEIEGREPGKKEDRAWYVAELEQATGKRSTKACNRMDDYEAACAHFEGLWGGGIKWQLKKERGNANRILHGVREIMAEADFSEAYMLEIAARVMGEHVGKLELLDVGAILAVRNALRKQVRRIVRQRAAAAAVETFSGEELRPF